MKRIVAMTIGLIAAFAVGEEAEQTATPPEVIIGYQLAAGQAAVQIINQVDELKAFQTSPAFNDLFTSETVQQEYEDRLTSFAATLTAVQDNLLSTATGVLIGGQNQLNAAKQMIKYRDASY